MMVAVWSDIRTSGFLAAPLVVVIDGNEHKESAKHGDDDDPDIALVEGRVIVIIDVFTVVVSRPFRCVHLGCFRSRS